LATLFLRTYSCLIQKILMRQIYCFYSNICAYVLVFLNDQSSFTYKNLKKSYIMTLLLVCCSFYNLLQNALA
jgi:hypothetical protein